MAHNYVRKYTLYIGTQDKETKVKELSDKEIIAVFDTVLENYTLIKAQGRYEYFDKTKCQEETFIIEIVDSELTTIKLENICTFIKNMLNQESIIVQQQVVQWEFI